MRLSPIRPELAKDDVLNRILLLVDYSNILYRSYFSSIKALEMRPWIPIVRFIDSLRLFAQRSSVGITPLEFIFAGESRKKLKRTELDETYKAQRVPVKDGAFKNFRRIMIRLLEDMDTQLVNRDGAEADDVIASIVGYICSQHDLPWEKPKENRTDVFIFSGDKDLYQLLRYDRCYIYKYPGVFYTSQNFLDDYGFLPFEYDAYKAMIGDRSDNIKGVNGIGPVKAKQHILNNTIPIDNLEFQKAFKLVSLDFDLDVPTVGDKLWFDETLSRAEPLIFDSYKKQGKRAFEEIQIAVKKFAVIVNQNYSHIL